MYVRLRNLEIGVSYREGRKPLSKTKPPSLTKGRGQGDRLLNDLSSCFVLDYDGADLAKIGGPFCFLFCCFTYP